MSVTAIEKKTLTNFINGQWVKSTTDKYEEVPNPATGEILAVVPISTQEDLDQAVQAAKKAFVSWRKVRFLSAPEFYSTINNC
jgi:malonate-semialdehyde dehydrogenase (acetylating) / methylmalonate-semialdehyde dehydrogenase